MNSKKGDTKPGFVFNLNNGEEAVLISYNKWNDVVVRLKRGNTKSAQIDALRRGILMDPMKPSLCGVGFMGVGEFTSKIKGVHTPEYSHWHDMICRCYNEKRLKKFNTYYDCTVCDEWMNFQTFAGWFSENYIEGYELDKDIKIKGNKEYSPDACMFVSRFDNNEAATAGRFCFISPDGDYTEVYNLSEFCRANDLSISCMSLVHSGGRRMHKGWVSGRSKTLASPVKKF